MTPSARILPRAWPAVLLVAALQMAWAWHGWARHQSYVDGLQGRANPVDVGDAASPTGYAAGQRELIVREGNEGSFRTISLVQQMLSRGEFRVRRVDYENAPFGHEVSSTSPYRWWLALIAWKDHAVSGRPLGLSVERAAAVADPVLGLLFLVTAAGFAAFMLGAWEAALVAIGAAAIFPLSSAFLPGMPDRQGFSSVLVFWSVLVFAVAQLPGARTRNWLVVSGVAGALGAWLSPWASWPTIAGLVGGGFLAARMSGPGAPTPWRAWSLSGGATMVAAWLIEDFPDRMGSLGAGSALALCGLAWIGLGECLAQADPRRAPGKRRALARAAAGLLVAAAVAAIASTSLRSVLGRSPGWGRLDWLPGGPSAPSLWAWLARDGASLTAAASLLPLLILALGSWALLRRSEDASTRPALAAAWVPSVAALVFAAGQIGRWAELDAALLALLAVAAHSLRGAGRRGAWCLAAATAAFALPGPWLTAPPAPAGAATALTPKESEELAMRHLAHWLEKRTGEPGFVVFAPPGETTELSFYGGLKGIGTYAPDNTVGFAASLTLAGAQSMEDVQADLQGRQVKYVILPTWDPFFDDFSRLYLVKELAARRSFLADQLRHWNLPAWLRAVPYQLPVGGGFEGQSVLVFEVVDPQSPAVAAGRLAEYLVEMGNLQGAQEVAERLRRYPGDVGALAADAQVRAAAGDTDGAAADTRAILERISNGGDRYLAWDRRVSVAVVLARAQRYELAAQQVRRCTAEATQERLRSLSTGSLFDLLVLAKSFHAGIPDPALRDLAADLLPPDLRAQL